MRSPAARLAAAFTVAACAALLAACNPIYFPYGRPSPNAAADAGMTVVSYRTVDDLVLDGWYRAATGRRPTLVYFHGNAGNLGSRAKLVLPYLEAGYGVLLAGYRGYGGNPGRPDEEGLYADGRAALAWLDGAGVPPDATVLFGESLGTGVAVQMAVEHSIAGLILQAPFTSTVDVGEEAVPFLPVSLFVTDRFDNLAKIPEIDAPLLLIHGEADNAVPIQFGRRLFEAAPEPKTAHFIPEAGHNDLHEFGTGRLVIAFLEAL